MIRRHSLVWLARPPSAPSWQEAATAWQEAGNPFMVCRTREGEELSLGFCLPSSDGAHPPVRIGVCAHVTDVESAARPPELFESASRLGLPGSLLSDLSFLEGCCSVRLIGSRMWQVITGVRYARPDSDLDLVLDICRMEDLQRIGPALLDASSRSPVRLDAEISLPFLGEIHWREWFSDSPSVMLKSRGGIRLAARDEIARLSGNAAP